MVPRLVLGRKVMDEEEASDSGREVRRKVPLPVVEKADSGEENQVGDATLQSVDDGCAVGAVAGLAERNEDDARLGTTSQ